MKIGEIFRRFVDKYLKFHCPECGGVMDCTMFDMVWNKLVYECRDCKKEWM